MDIDNYIKILIDCASEADDIARHYYYKKSFTVKEKSDLSVVTQADLEIETKIRDFIFDLDIKMDVLGEEFDSNINNHNLKLIIDPIDGTSNFVRRIPLFGSLLALELDGKVIAGVVSNPISKERWVAAKNKGTSYNGDQIFVSTVSEIYKSQSFYGSLYGQEARGNSSKLLNLLSKTKRQRGIGDFLMHMWIASGYGEFAIDFGLKPWDLAPLGIIVEEAGGVVTQVNGQPFSIYEGSILSSNGQFHDQLVHIYNNS